MHVNSIRNVERGWANVKQPPVHSEKTYSFADNEDHLNPSTILYMHKDSPFLHDTQRIGEEIGMKIKCLSGYEVSEEGVKEPMLWCRDTFYKVQDTVCIVPDFAGLKGKFEKKWRRFDQPIILSNEATKTIFHTYKLTNPKQTGEVVSFEKQQTCFSYLSFVDDYESQFYSELKASSLSPERIKFKSTSLEGGNLITVSNGERKLKFIVGESAIAHFSFYKELFLSQSQCKERDEMYKSHIKEESHGYQKWFLAYQKSLSIKDPLSLAADRAKERISKKYAIAYELSSASEGPFSIETKKDIIAVPQWTYHIDLQMSYLGQGQILIHSFEKTLDFLTEKKSEILNELESINLLETVRWKESALALYEKLILLNTHLVAEFENSIINEAIRKLEKHGLTVHKCLGNLFHGALEEGVPQKMICAFMNGLSGYSDQLGCNYFLTVDSPLICLKTYFEELLAKQFGMKTYFLNVTNPRFPQSPSMTMSTFDETEGSFRCQTNTNLG
jgi:hypothetical protein